MARHCAPVSTSSERGYLRILANISSKWSANSFQGRFNSRTRRAIFSARIAIVLFLVDGIIWFMISSFGFARELGSGVWWCLYAHNGSSTGKAPIRSIQCFRELTVKNLLVDGCKIRGSHEDSLLKYLAAEQHRPVPLDGLFTKMRDLQSITLVNTLDRLSVEKDLKADEYRANCKRGGCSTQLCICILTTLYMPIYWVISITTRFTHEPGVVVL